jgi:PAS domain S-box-containing protein
MVIADHSGSAQPCQAATKMGSSKTRVGGDEGQARTAWSRLEDSAAHAKLGFWEYDPQRSRFRASDVVYRVLDLDASVEVDLEAVSKACVSEPAGMLTRAVELAVKEGKPFSLVSEVQTASGQRKWVRIQGHAVERSDARSHEVAGTLQDISEIRLLDRITQESEMTLNQVEEITHIGHFSVSLEDGSVFHSDEIKRIFGYEPSEYALSVEEAIEAYHPDDRAEVVRLFNRAAETGEGYEFDLRIVRPSGEIRQVHSKGYTEQDEQGKVTRVYGVFQDITELKEMEDRLHQAEKMKAIGQLAGGVAHDFNNQLMVMSSFASVLDKRVQEGSVEHSCVSGILAGVSRSSELTKQMLAFARKGKYVVTTVDMDALISEVVSMARHSFDKKIRITHHASVRPATIAGDVSQLQNALLNMALNSRDAMPQGGELTFATERVTLDEPALKGTDLDAQPGEYLRVSICDTGVGMDAATQKHIFEPFYTTKEPGKGTGMGMASAYGTVKNHHGAIDVQSEVGAGTTITMHFPLAVGKNARSEALGPSTERTGGRILIVDDEDGVAAAVAMMLEANGYETARCANGREALNEFKHSRQDTNLVLLDMNMPEMNGVETLAGLKAIDPDVKVILISGYSLADEAERVTDEGAAGFLVRPFTEAELLRTISEVLHRDPPGASSLSRNSSMRRGSVSK